MSLEASENIRNFKKAFGVDTLEKRYEIGRKHFNEVLAPKGYMIGKSGLNVTLELNNKVILHESNIIDLFDKFDKLGSNE